MVRVHYFQEALYSKFLVGRVPGLNHAIGDQNNLVSALQRERGLRVLRIRERAQHQTVLHILGTSAGLRLPPQERRMGRASVLDGALAQVHEQIGGRYILALELARESLIQSRQYLSGMAGV